MLVVEREGGGGGEQGEHGGTEVDYQAAVGLVNALTRFEDFVMCLKKPPFSKQKQNRPAFSKASQDGFVARRLGPSYRIESSEREVRSVLGAQACRSGASYSSMLTA